MDSVSNISNFHVYTSTGPSRAGLAGGASWAKKYSPGEPVYITEFGYLTPDWITEAQESYYMLDGVMNAFDLGIQNIFVYELMDGNLWAGDDYGLFHVDGTPKLAATSIHNLMTILASTEGPTADSSSNPPPTVIGLSATGYSLALANGQGGYDVLIWDEGSGSNVTVNLAASYVAVAVYDPVQSEAPLQTLKGASQLNAAIGTDPIIITLGSH